MRKSMNLYEHILYKDTSSATPLTKSTIAVTAETITFTHIPTTAAFAEPEAETTLSTYSTTITNNNNNNNNKTYFIKLSGISQGDPMEGFPQYSGGNRRE